MLTNDLAFTADKADVGGENGVLPQAQRLEDSIVSKAAIPRSKRRIPAVKPSGKAEKPSVPPEDL